MSEPRDYRILREELSYQGFFRIKSYTLQHTLFEGGWCDPIQRELFMRDDAVGVLLYDPGRDEVVLVEQFRVGLLPAGGVPWVSELVAGIIEPGEAAEEVARRESIEETGCPVKALLPIAQYYSSPGGSSEFFHLFCGRVDADGAGGVHGLPTEGEDIKVHVHHFDEVVDMMQRGQVQNAHTLIALQWLMLNKSQVRTAWA